MSETSLVIEFGSPVDLLTDTGVGAYNVRKITVPFASLESAVLAWRCLYVHTDETGGDGDHTVIRGTVIQGTREIE